MADQDWGGPPLTPDDDPFTDLPFDINSLVEWDVDLPQSQTDGTNKQLNYSVCAQLPPVIDMFPGTCIIN
jgi:hypothetical protein